MNISRRNFIGGTVAAGAYFAFGIPATGRIARIGHMTDTHVVGKAENFECVPFTLPDGKDFTGTCELSFFFRPEIKGNRFTIRRLRLLAP